MGHVSDSGICTLLATGLLLSACSSAIAQLIPDSTLGAESTTIKSVDALTDLIEGGALRDHFLFHSFLEFNVGEGRTVNFANPTGVTDIFSRVTGSNSSQILGQLGVMGEANLFLLNPHGIVFGPNARLDVRGSFIGTTAESILFNDGFAFGVNPSNTPLLTIDVPIGLQYGTHSGNIVNRSQVTNSNGDHVGLQVPPGKTLALLGGTVSLEGGYLTAPQGRIDVGGIGSGATVSLIPSQNSWRLGYAGIEQFRDIQLTQAANLDTSGAGGGRIELWGDAVTLAEGSAVFADTRGNQDGQGILIHASQFRVLDGSQVSASSLEESTGKNGTITVNSTEFVELIGSGRRNFDTNPVQGNNSGGGSGNNSGGGSGNNSGGNSGNNSGGGSGNNSGGGSGNNSGGGSGNNSGGGSGNNSGGTNNDLQPSKLASDSRGLSQESADLEINTPRLILRDGAKISTSTIDSPGGNVLIHASESVELEGVRSDGERATGISVQTRGVGKVGNLEIDTRRLIVQDGAEVIASTFDNGDGGNVEIDATESVEILGTSPDGRLFSRLVAGTGELRTTDVGNVMGRGNAGEVRVTTPRLTVREGQISADSQGVGKGGNIKLNVDVLTLRDRAAIFTDTESTEGGNINIDTDVLTALENSDITANATSFKGGRVTIDTQGIFGIEFREQLTPHSDITATGANSDLNGTVIVNTPDLDPTSGLLELPSSLVDITHLIAQTCSVTDGEDQSQFTVTGRGGLPPNPRESIRSDSAGLADLGRSILPAESESYSPNFSLNLQESPVLVEANGWEIRSDGTIVLVATAPTHLPPRIPNVPCKL